MTNYIDINSWEEVRPRVKSPGDFDHSVGLEGTPAQGGITLGERKVCICNWENAAA